MACPILLILNPSAAAGRAPKRWDGLRSELARRGVLVDHALSQAPGHATQLALAGCDRYEVIAAVGGDGTVNEVTNGIMSAPGPRRCLAIVPFGTGNDAAHHTGIHTQEDAVAALAGDQRRPTDVIEVAHGGPGAEQVSHSLLFAAVGFAGELIKRTTPLVKRILGPRFCYSAGFLRAWASYRCRPMRVTTDTAEFSGRFFHVCAGNSEYGGGGVMRMSPGARMDDGRLELCVIEGLSRLEILRCFPRLLRGTHITHPRVRYFPGRTLRVESWPDQELQLDGDLIGRTPATFTVLPSALRILVPRPAR